MPAKRRSHIITIPITPFHRLDVATTVYGSGGIRGSYWWLAMTHRSRRGNLTRSLPSKWLDDKGYILRVRTGKYGTEAHPGNAIREGSIPGTRIPGGPEWFESIRPVSVRSGHGTTGQGTPTETLGHTLHRGGLDGNQRGASRGTDGGMVETQPYPETPGVERHYLGSGSDQEGTGVCLDAQGIPDLGTSRDGCPDGTGLPPLPEGEQVNVCYPGNHEFNGGVYLHKSDGSYCDSLNQQVESP